MAELPPPQTATYDRALYGSGKPWRGILAILSFVVGFLILSLVFGLIAIVFDLLTGTADLDGLMSGAVEVSPAIMLMNNLSIAAAIPLAMLLQRAFFGVRFRSLWSVENRFRWGWFGRLALVIVPIWALYIGISFLFEPAGEIRLDGTVIALLVIVVLTTPLQAAGEEVGARGLIQRSVGSWFRNPTVGFLVSTVIAGIFFTLAHFAADPWLIVYYFVFAASASLITRFTGGLEAATLLHAVNNLLIFVPTILLGQLDQSFDRSEGVADASMLISIAVVVAVAALIIWLARRRRLETRVAIPLRRPNIPAPVPPAH